MKLKILSYREGLDNYRCEDEKGHQLTVDLTGEFDGVDPSELVGRTIECEELIPFVRIPSGRTRLLPMATADVTC